MTTTENHDHLPPRERLSDGELRMRVEALQELQRGCQLCPRKCGGSRQARPGYCHQPAEVMVAAICSHHGEEPVLSGKGGAGTVFVAGCSMRCVFCQNHQISQGTPLPRWSHSVEALANQFLELERCGSHNIEWVSPTAHLPGLVDALRLARRKGLTLPLVYNSNGYERVTTLRLLEGIVDIYLPDAKYHTEAIARSFSDTPDYVPVNQRALQEMWRQVGPLQLDEGQIAQRGLLIRHLILPAHIENTKGVIAWIGKTFGPRVWISLMAQYYPTHLVHQRPNLAALRRTLTHRELARATAALHAAGLDQGWVQEISSCVDFLPDFHLPDPFGKRDPT